MEKEGERRRRKKKEGGGPRDADWNIKMITSLTERVKREKRLLISAYRLFKIQGLQWK